MEANFSPVIMKKEGKSENIAVLARKKHGKSCCRNKQLKVSHTFTTHDKKRSKLGNIKSKLQYVKVRIIKYKVEILRFTIDNII